MFRTMAIIAVILAVVGSAYAEAPLVVLSGTDFKGGAAEVFGSVQNGEVNVNYVYAKPTGARSTMRAVFDLAQAPQSSLFLHVKGRDCNVGPVCAVRIDLNGQALFEGKNDFSKTAWQTHKFAIPAGLLKAGQNTLTISNIETEGPLGNVPWFQVAQAVIAGETFVITRDVTKDFWVTLPKTVRPFPEPLKPGEKPGFAMRGMKGWLWLPEQYVSEIPVMAKYKMNFLQNCYGSMCDIEHCALGDPNINRWWEDLPPTKKAAYENVVKQCQKNGIEFCFSMNPNLWSKRALDYNSAKDLDDLYKHYAWMQGLGVHWFNISLDDISNGIDPAGQSKVVNEIYRRLKVKDPTAHMIFCPTIYWGDGISKESERKYLETIATDLDKDIYLFWTGDSVVGQITRKAAESYKRTAGHKLFLWDNYPVNDGQQTMHLGPIAKRDADLCEEVYGYMSNPMHTQTEANRMPVLTCMDYAYNPSAYDPERSIGQAIMHLEPTPQGREVLKDLVELYPGFIICGHGGTGQNAVRDQFLRIVSSPHSKYLAEADVRHLEDVLARMNKVFSKRYGPEKQTLKNDIKFAKDMLTARYGGQ